MSNQFPNIKALGIEVHGACLAPNNGSIQFPADEVVLAFHLEHLLEQAPVVYGKADGSIHNELHYPWTGESREQDTYTARLVGIKPIVRDTAEGLLREMVECWNGGGAGHAKLYERARALLAKESK